MPPLHHEDHDDDDYDNDDDDDSVTMMVMTIVIVVMMILGSVCGHLRLHRGFSRCFDQASGYCIISQKRDIPVVIDKSGPGPVWTCWGFVMWDLCEIWLILCGRLTEQNMDDDDNLVISWQDFESRSPEIIRNLWKDEDFSDVTLATDDGQIVRAHRVVICSASSKLKRLLRVHKHDNPIVYLPDIDFGHLVNLVEFIYQGKCQVRADLLEEFLSFGKSLGVANMTEYFQKQENDVKHEAFTENKTINPSRKEDIFPADSEKNDIPPENIETSISLIQANVKSGLCKICNRKFAKLKQHIKSRHSQREKKTCTVCNMKFAQKKCLKQHFETQHTGKEKKKCNICKFESHRKSALNQHIERVHQGKMLNCKDCSFQAKTRDNMKYHMKSFHDGVTTMKCDECEYECEYKINCTTKMLLHKETMHGQTTYNCDKCDYESKSKQHFMRHKRHSHSRPKIVCGQCAFSTKVLTHLKYHVKSAHEGVRWTCDACDRKFNSPAVLKLHRGKEHDKKLYTSSCTVCDFVVETKFNPKTKAQMNNHMDMIHRDNIYKCEKCSYTTKINNSMKSHLASHKNRENSSFVCDQCSYTSKQKGHLDIHVRSKHKGEVLKCEICNYSATQLSNLTRHRRAKHKELLPT